MSETTSNEWGHRPHMGKQRASVESGNAKVTEIRTVDQDHFYVSMSSRQFEDELNDCGGFRKAYDSNGDPAFINGTHIVSIIEVDA